MNETDTEPVLIHIQWLQLVFPKWLTEIVNYLGLSDVYGEAVNYVLLASFTIFKILIIYTILGGITYAFVNKTPAIVISKRVLFVIAHPDDEVMFFGPTIMRLRQTCHVQVLCLSNGNYYGHGSKRKIELWNSCETLGIPPENIVLMNNTRMKDDPDFLWNTRLTARIIADYVHTMGIDEVYTFDIGGVSGHLNHVSIFYAFAHLCLKNELPPHCNVYLLDSVNIMRKYSFFLDVAISCLPFSQYVFVIPPTEVSILKNAMQAHRSQLVWFRYLYMIFSRYAYINTYKLLEPEDVQLVLQMDDREHFIAF